jgi:hypothetical protein
MSLQTLKRRVEKLEAICAQKRQHVVVVFNGTPEADEQAEKLFAQGRLDAERLGKKLQVIRIGWFGSQ